MTQYVRENIEKIETPILTWALIGVFGLLICSYAYFINATIANAMAKTTLENELSALTSSLGVKETEYITAKRGISLAMAHTLGFVEAGKEKTTFVSFQSGLTFNR
jgi:hypothetical protein